MTLFAKIDCDLPRNPRLIEAGPMARLMYVQCVLYARENLTDGVIDRFVLPLVAVDIPDPEGQMARLAEVGALESHERGWCIPARVWTARNPLKHEVDAFREAEALRKRSYRDRKRQGETVPDVSQRDSDDACPMRDGQPEPEGERENTRRLASADSPEFDAFWKAYPRRIGKGQARRAWKAAARKVERPEVIIDAARRFAAVCHGREERFIPHPSSWLNGERWADEEPRTMASGEPKWMKR